MASVPTGPIDIERHLMKDEKVLWHAVPLREHFLKYVLSHDPGRLFGYYFFFFGLLMAFLTLPIIIGWLVSGRHMEDPGILFLPAFGLVFAGIGWSLSSGRK